MSDQLFLPAPPRGQSGLSWIVVLSVVLVAVSALFPVPELSSVRFLGVGLALWLSALAWFAPRRLRYTLQDDALLIQTLFSVTRLPTRHISAWRTRGGLGLKVGGTGLAGYYTGYYTFNADEIKTVMAASSNTSNGVIVQAEGKAYFLTPADPDAFLEELARRGARVRP